MSFKYYKFDIKENKPLYTFNHDDQFSYKNGNYELNLNYKITDINTSNYFIKYNNKKDIIYSSNLKLLKLTSKYFIKNYSLFNFNQINQNLYQTNHIEYDVYINRTNPDTREYPELIYFHTNSNINIITNNNNIISNINSNIIFNNNNTKIIPGYNYTLFINNSLVYNYGYNNIHDPHKEYNHIYHYYTYNKTENIYFIEIDKSYDHNEIQNMLATVNYDIEQLNIFIGSTSILYSLQGSGLEINFDQSSNLQNIKRVNITNNGKIYGFHGNPGHNGINIINNDSERIINIINNGEIWRGGSHDTDNELIVDYNYTVYGEFQQNFKGQLITFNDYITLLIPFQGLLDIMKSNGETYNNFFIFQVEGQYWHPTMGVITYIPDRVVVNPKTDIENNLQNNYITKLIYNEEQFDNIYYIESSGGFQVTPDEFFKIDFSSVSTEHIVEGSVGTNLSSTEPWITYTNGITVLYNNFEHEYQSYDFNVENSGLYYDILIVGGGGSGENSYSSNGIIYPGGGGGAGNVILIQGANLDLGIYHINVGYSDNYSSFSNIIAESGGNGGSQIGESIFNRKNLHYLQIAEDITGVNGWFHVKHLHKNATKWFPDSTSGNKDFFTLNNEIFDEHGSFTKSFPEIFDELLFIRNDGSSNIFIYCLKQTLQNILDSSQDAILRTSVINTYPNYAVDLPYIKYKNSSNIYSPKLMVPTYEEYSLDDGPKVTVYMEHFDIDYSTVYSADQLETKSTLYQYDVFVRNSSTSPDKFKSDFTNVFYFKNIGGLLNCNIPGGGGGAGNRGNSGIENNYGGYGGYGGDGLSIGNNINFKINFNINDLNIGEHIDENVYFGKGGNGGNNGDNIFVKNIFNYNTSFYIDRHTTVAINNDIYFLDGVQSDSPPEFYKLNITNYIIFNNIEKITLNNKDVFDSDNRFNLHDYTMVSIGNNIYIFGGCRDPYATNTNNFYKIDTNTNNLNKITLSIDIPGRRQHTMVAIGNNLYIYGGESGEWGNYGLLNDFYKIDTTSTTNTYICEVITLNGILSSDTPTKRKGHTMVAIGNYIYIYGGETANGLPTNDFYRIDTTSTTNTYTCEKITFNGKLSSDIPTARRNHTMVAIGNNLYIYGGHDGAHLWISSLNDFYQINTITNFSSKITLNGVSPGKTSHSMVAIGIYIYIYGGFNNFYYYDDLYILKFDNNVIPNTGNGGNGGNSGNLSLLNLGGLGGSGIVIIKEYSIKSSKLYKISLFDGLHIDNAANGYDYSILLNTSNNLVYSYGKNEFGQLGLTNNENMFLPTEITKLTGSNINFVACGYSHSIFLNTDNNLVYSCGDNKYGQLGLNHNINISIPTEITTLIGCNINKVVCGDYHTIFLNTSNNLVYSCGKNTNGQLGLYHYCNISIPTEITTLRGCNINKVVCGNNYSVFLNTNNSLVYYCGNSNIVTNLSYYNKPQLITSLNNLNINTAVCGNSNIIFYNQNKKYCLKNILPISTFDYLYKSNERLISSINSNYDKKVNISNLTSSKIISISFNHNLNDYYNNIYTFHEKYQYILNISNLLNFDFDFNNNNYYYYYYENQKQYPKRLLTNIYYNNHILINYDIISRKLNIFINNNHISTDFNYDLGYNLNYDLSYNLIYKKESITELKYIFTNINENNIKYFSDIYLIGELNKFEIYNYNYNTNSNNIIEYYHKYLNFDINKKTLETNIYNDIIIYNKIGIYNNIDYGLPNNETLKIFKKIKNRIIELEIFKEKNNTIIIDNLEITFNNGIIQLNKHQYSNIEKKYNIPYDLIRKYEYINNEVYITYSNLTKFINDLKNYREYKFEIIQNNLNFKNIKNSIYQTSNLRATTSNISLNIESIIYKDNKYYFLDDFLDDLNIYSLNNNDIHLKITENNFIYLNNSVDIEKIKFINNNLINNDFNLDEIVFFYITPESTITFINYYIGTKYNLYIKFKIYFINDINIDIIFNNEYDNKKNFQSSQFEFENIEYPIDTCSNININIINNLDSHIIFGIYDFKIKYDDDDDTKIKYKYIKNINTEQIKNIEKELINQDFYVIPSDISDDNYRIYKEDKRKYYDDKIIQYIITEYKITEFSKKNFDSYNIYIYIEDDLNTFYQIISPTKTLIDRLNIQNIEHILDLNISELDEFKNKLLDSTELNLYFQRKIGKNFIKFKDLITTFNSENIRDSIFLIDNNKSINNDIDNNLGKYYGFITNNTSITEKININKNVTNLKIFKINYNILINENIPKFNQFNIDNNFIITTITKPLENILNIVFDYSRNIVYFNTGYEIYRFFYKEKNNNILFTHQKIIYYIDFNNDDNEFIFNMKLSKDNNYLILSDYYNNTIKLLTLKNNYLYIIAGTFNIAGNISIYNQLLNKYISRIYRPTDLVIKNDNNIIFIDSFNGSIKEIEFLTNTISIITGPILDDDDEWINKYKFQAEFKHKDNSDPNKVRFNNPKSIAINKDNSLLYIADTNNNCIRLVYLSGNNYGKTETIVGQQNIKGDLPSINNYNSIKGNEVILNNPQYISISNDDEYLFICDTNNNCIKYTKLTEPYTYNTKRINDISFIKPNYIIQHPKGYFIINDSNKNKLYLLYFNNSLFKPINNIKFSNFKETTNSDNFTINKYISSGNIDNDRLIESKLKIDNFNINLKNMTKLNIGDDNRYLLIYDDNIEYDNILYIKIYLIDTIYNTVEPILNKDYFIFDLLEKVNLNEYLIPYKRNLKINPIYKIEQDGQITKIYKNNSLNSQDHDYNYQLYHNKNYNLRFNGFNDPKFKLLYTNIFVINDKKFDLSNKNSLNDNNLKNIISKLIGDTLIFSLYLVKNNENEKIIIPLISLKNNKLIKLFKFIKNSNYINFNDLTLNYNFQLCNLNSLETNSNFNELFTNNTIYKSELNIINLKNDNVDNDNCFEITLHLIDKKFCFLKEIYFFRFILTDIDITLIKQQFYDNIKDIELKDKINEFNLNLNILTLYNDFEFFTQIYNSNILTLDLSSISEHIEFKYNPYSLNNFNYPGLYNLNYFSNYSQNSVSNFYFNIIDYNTYISITNTYEIKQYSFNNHGLRLISYDSNNIDFSNILNGIHQNPEEFEKNTNILINKDNNSYEIIFLNTKYYNDNDNDNDNNNFYLNLFKLKDNTLTQLLYYRNDNYKLTINKFPVYINEFNEDNILYLRDFNSLTIKKDLSSLYILNDNTVYKLKLDNNLIIDIKEKQVNFKKFTLNINFNLLIDYLNLKIINNDNNYCNINYQYNDDNNDDMNIHYKIYEIKNDYLKTVINNNNITNSIELQINFDININIKNYIDIKILILNFDTYIFDKVLKDHKGNVKVDIINEINLLSDNSYNKINLYYFNQKTINYNNANKSNYFILNSNVQNTLYLYQEIIEIKLKTDLDTTDLNTTDLDNYIINLFDYNTVNTCNNSTINLKIVIDTYDDQKHDIYILNNIQDGKLGLDGINGIDGKEPIEINLDKLLEIYTKLKYLTLEFSENISIYGSAGNGIYGKNIDEIIGEVGKGGRIINIIIKEDINNFLNFNINFNNTNKLYIGGDGNIGSDYIKAKLEKGYISQLIFSSHNFTFLTQVNGTYAVTHNYARYQGQIMLTIFINYISFEFSSAELNGYSDYRNIPTGNYDFGGLQHLYDNIEGSIFQKNGRYFQIKEAMSVNKVESVSFYKGRYDLINGLTERDFRIKYWEVSKIKIKKAIDEDPVDETLGSIGTQYNTKTINNKQRIKINGLEISDNPNEDNYNNIPNLNLKINYN
jgi:hypothetical protein